MKHADHPRFCRPLVIIAVTLTTLCAGAADPAAAVANFPSTSLYNLESPWVTQANAPFTWNHVAGKVVVLTMMFTSCEYTCPRIVETLRRIEAEIPQSAKDRVQFVMASFDSDGDTPEVLRKYAVTRRLDTSRWTLLHGSADTVSELAAALDLRYKKVPKVGFSHANLISVLNQHGDIMVQLRGLNADTAPASTAIRRLLQTP